MKKPLGPMARVYPTPIPLVMSGVGDEASMLAVAWAMPAGRKPPSIAMIVGKRHHTYELIEKTGEFTVNFAPSCLHHEVDYCGLVSGRDTNKVEDVRFTLVESEIVSVPMIAECPFNHECRLVAEYDLPSTSHMIVGEIVQSHANEDVLNEDGDELDIMKLDPLVYATGVREYFRLGERLADAYSCGRTLME
jgi:flavin reductase (DIM6/NTAB) family NADH-FMN oxidoreductase RutF